MKHGLLAALLFAGTVCMAENLLVNGDMKTGKGWSLWGNKPGDAKTQAKILYQSGTLFWERTPR